MDKKRKVGGVVIMRPGQNNYGTSLQGLATIKVVESLGYSMRIIRYNKKRTIMEIIRTIPGYLRSGAFAKFLHTRNQKKLTKQHSEFARIKKERTEAVNKFKQKYLEPLCDYYTGWYALCEGSKNYDVVFVGSDQVWGPLSLYAGFYNLLFVDKSVPQFSYSSSFGKSFIMEHQKKGVARFLNKMDAIAVREVHGAEIVKELTGRDATVVADPTLLLSKEEWQVLVDEDAKTKNILPQTEKYMLCYMLGPRKDNRESVRALGKELGVKVISFNHMDWYEPADEDFGDEVNCDSDCLDFVRLLANAEYVVTDSFHCSVFSIIFHKKFLTYYRLKPTDKKSSHSRIESLFTLLGIKDRAVKDINDDLKDRLARDIDWANVDLKLANLKHDSMEFLKNALEIQKV